MSQKSVEIIPGVFMPMMGLGTFRITEPSRVHLAVDAALSCGYRMLDTAAVYQNEVEIGVALDQLLPKHQLARTDLFVTTKLQSTSMGGDGKTTEGFRLSLDKLRLDYVDLYLIHYPKAEWLEKTDTKNRAIREATWREMEEILASGKAKAIGVSNYEIRHLEEMKAYARVTPAVNQVEFHPHLNRAELRQYCLRHHIHLQGFTPLGRNHPDLIEESVVQLAATKHRCTPAQILLSWAMALGVSVMPKSSDPGRIQENFGATLVDLSETELNAISGLNRDVPYTSCRPWEVV